MQDYRKGSHTVYDIKFHYVWVTKYRFKVLRGDLALRVREAIREVCMAYDVKILKGSVGADHIHLFVSVPPTLAPSRLAQYLKGKSSYVIQREFPEIHKRYWGQHIWARGYFCGSSGTITDEMIKEYIANQGKDLAKDDGFNVEESTGLSRSEWRKPRS